MNKLRKNKEMYFIITGLLVLLFIEQTFAIKYYGLSQPYTFYVLTINIILSTGIIAGVYEVFKDKLNIERLYLVFGTAIGIVFLVLMPVFTAPDEPVHIYSTYKLSNQIMGLKEDDGIVALRVEDVQLPVIVTYSDIDTYNNYLSNVFSEGGNSDLMNCEADITGAPFYTYLPAAIGLTLGRLLNLNTIQLYLFGRLMNLLAFLGITYCALKKLPFGKITAFIILVMPMTMQLAASFSYDWFIISISILVTSLSLNSYYSLKKNEQIDKLQLGLLIASGFLLFTVKGHAYFPLSLLTVTLLAVNRYPLSKKAKKGIGLLIGGLIVSFVVYTGIMGLTDAEPFTVPENYITYLDYQGYTIQFILNHPIQVFVLIAGTLVHYGMILVESSVGNYLGWLDIMTFTPAVYIIILALLMSVYLPESEDDEVDQTDKKVMLATGILSILFIFAGAILQWTPEGAEYAYGVQGRYFIPTALIMLFAIKTDDIVVSGKFTRPICLSVMVAVYVIIEFLIIIV